MGMITARRVVGAYAARAKAKDRFKWSQDNPDLQAIIDEAEILRIEAMDG